MSVSSPDPRGRSHDPVVIVLAVAVAILLGILAALSPSWAIGIPVALAAVPVILWLASSTARED